MRDHNHDVASSYCPSQDWDRYVAGHEMPEECPICGKPNSTEDGEYICPDAPAFCSVPCQQVFLAEELKRADAMVKEMQEERRLIAEHNAKCPSCKHSEKFCFCPTNPDNQEG